MTRFYPFSSNICSLFRLANKNPTRRFCSSSSSTTTTSIATSNVDENKSTEDAAATNRHLISETNCEPTQILQEVMKTDDVLRQKVQRIQQEFKIYEYFASYVPNEFKDKNWVYLLKSTSVIERVRYFWFMGQVEYKDQKDNEKRAAKKKEKQEMFIENMKKYNAGKMAYGIQGYNLVFDPFNQRTFSIFTSWYVTQLSLGRSVPRLLFDCQFLPHSRSQEYNNILRSAAHAFFVNYERRDPFPTSFINVDDKDHNTRNLITRQIIPPSISTHHVQQRILPELYRNDPFHNSAANRQTDESEQVIYISKFANEVFDGPLKHKAYIIPLTFDHEKESIGAVRRNNYRAMYFPIMKYIKWKTGPIKISYVVAVNILHEVANNGGNWELALQKHIPHKNTRSTEERKELIGEERYQLMRDIRQEKGRIEQHVIDTLGHQPAVFNGGKRAFSRALDEYVSRIKNF